MYRKFSKNLKFSFGSFLVVLFFIVVSYLVEINRGLFESWMDLGFLGVFIYFLITVIATVIVPVSALPLLPVAVFLWGFVNAALISIVGWTVGSLIAFLLARKYGVKIVEKFVSVEKIAYYESFIPKKHLFLGILVMRMFLPVDVLSYILGVFSKVDVLTYFFATLIGVSPFAFVFAYMGSLPIKFQLFGFLILFLVLAFIYHEFNKNFKKRY